MVLRPFPRRRRPLLLVLSTRHPVQPRSFPIQELHRAFRPHEAAAEGAKIARLRAGGADRVRASGLTTRVTTSVTRASAGRIARGAPSKSRFYETYRGAN